MFKNKAFWARLFRLMGAALVLSTGYFVYLDNQLLYSDATIVRYEDNHPIIRFNVSSNEKITYKMPTAFNAETHPVGSYLPVRFPEKNYEKLEYVTPLLQWAFYIVLFIGLIIFFIGAVLTIQVRKQLKK